MKITICFFFVVLVVAIDAFPHKFLVDKKGFKTSMSDRISHGFGKRTDISNDDTLNRLDNSDDSDRGWSNDVIAEAIRKTPSLAEKLVAKYLDSNGDGYVSQHELFEAKRSA